MIFLLLSILFSTAISLIFKLLSHLKADNVQVIFWNYCTCILCGWITQPKLTGSGLPFDWSYVAVLSGILFIVVFLMMAKTAQEFGISVSVVSSKMAVIFPVGFGIWIAGEALEWTTAFGILISIVSVLLVAFSSGDAHGGKHLYIPLLVFVGSGVIDALLKFISWKYDSPDASTLSMHIFGGAAISGLVYLLAKRSTFKLRNAGLGIVLGIPNFFSIYFLLKAIGDPQLPAVVLFPVNNIGIVLLGTLLSIVFWKEKMQPKKLAGILLALISIALISVQLVNS